MKKLFFILALFSLSLNAVYATEQDIVDRSAVALREFPLQGYGHLASFDDVRCLATFCLILLCTPLLKAQHQEPSLIDRLLRPNMELQSSAQGKIFTANSAFVERRGTVGTFYLQRSSTEKQFADVRNYSATVFPSRAFNSDRGAVATTQSKRANPDAQIKASSVRDVHSEVTASSFADQRAFQEQGKSQQSLDRKNPPLTIDQVRELLNKNK